MTCGDLRRKRGTIFLHTFLVIFSGIFGNLHRIGLKVTGFYMFFYYFCVGMTRGTHFGDFGFFNLRAC